MDKQKQQQTEELYKDLSSIMSEEYEKRMLITPSYCAEKMLEKGYRKIPEGAVVLSREEYDELQIGKDFNYGYHSGESNMTSYYENIRLPEVRKETAEKFAEMAKERKIEMGTDGHSYCMVFVEDIDEICKEITEGKVNE